MKKPSKAEFIANFPAFDLPFPDVDPMYYDRQGKPITLAEWCYANTYEPESRTVGRDHLPNGYFVSTVWLGLDHSMGVAAKAFGLPSQPPIIFETMVFDETGDKSDLDMERYSTEAEAIAGHAEMVARWSRKKNPRFT